MSAREEKEVNGMKKNMGTADRAVRVIVAVIFGVLILTNAVSGVLAGVLGVLAVVFVLTSIVGFCPLYVPFGISTMKKEAK
jgi:uncharacterized MAPEG superfamily protein